MIKAKIFTKGGTHLEILFGTSDEETKNRTTLAMKAGNVVEWPDGSKTWYTETVVFDPSKEGSEAYQWDKSRNKVLVEVWKVTQKGSSATREKVGEAYRRFETSRQEGGRGHPE